VPFIGPTFSHISRVLLLHNIKTVSCPLRKVSQFLRPVKDTFDLKTPDIYSIPYECGKFYNGKTSHSIETGIKEHHQII
jgi:hypothetical protein